MSRVRSILPFLLIAALAVFAGPAGAQTFDGGAGPIQVAGPPPGPPTPVPPGLTEGEAEAQAEAEQTDAERTARLFVGVMDRGLCLSYEPDRATERFGEALDEGESGDEGLACVRVPRDDAYEPFVLRLERNAFRARPADDAPTAGAVRADVAAIEFQGEGRRTVRLPTVAAPAPLAGTVAADLRFFLGRVPAIVRTWRLIGADGRLLYERDEASRSEGRAVRPPVRIASGGRGTGRWSMSVEVRNVLAPVHGEPGRRVRSLCHAVVRPQGGRSGSCVPLPLEDAHVFPNEGCATGGPNLVTGLARTGDLPRRLIATDGTAVPFRVLRLPAAFGAPDVRAVVAVAPGGAGIRRVEGGFPVAWGTPPTALSSCSSGSFGDIIATRRAAGEPELGGDTVLRPAGAGGPRLFVRDRDAELCLGVERAVRASDCSELPPVLANFGARPVAGGRMVAGVVDARVTRLRLTVSTGARIEVPAARDPAYTGRFAPYLAFFGATAPAGATFTRIAIIGPHGTVLEELPLQTPVLTGPARRSGTVRVRGVARTVAQAPWSLGTDCTFTTAASALPGTGDACPYQQGIERYIEIEVPCGKDAVVGGTVGGRGARGLRVVLASGRRLAAPVVRLGDGDAVAYVTVPRRAAIRRVEVVGRGGRVLRRYATAVPRSTEHCGYEDGLFGDGGLRGERPGRGA